ncbi:MAG: TetR/AcrR family transcriptional regulator [Candidatus Cryptobacteroides sp.]
MNRKDNKEKDILKAAQKLFAEKGFKGATTKLIAAEAGVTHAMLHYYFRTKEQIFLKVLDSYVDEVRVSLKAIMVPDVYEPEVIGKVTEILFDFFNGHRGQLSLFLEVANERPDLLETYVSEFGRYLGPVMSSHRDRTVKAVGESRISPIRFEALLLDILSVCTSHLFFEPVLTNLFRMDEASERKYLEERKSEAVAMIVSRLTYSSK